MKKGALAVLSGFLFLLSAGCSNTTPQPTQNFEPSDALLFADLFSWMINFDGYEIQFPMTVREFTHATSTYTDTNSKQMIEQHKTGMTYINTGDGHRMSVYIFADTDAESISVGECALSEITINSYEATLILPKGITFESTREDIILTYGEPTKEEKGVLTYIDPAFSGLPAPFQPGTTPAIEFRFNLYDGEDRDPFFSAVRYTGMTA